MSPDTLGTICPMTYCTVLWFPYFERVPGNLKMKNWNEFLRMTTALYCTLVYHTVLYRTVPYCTVLYHTVPYCTVLYCTVTYCSVSCWYTPLNQAIYAWSFRQKFSGWWVGDIAIIASSSRSRSDFEIELYIEICDRTWNWLWPGLFDLDPSLTIECLSIRTLHINRVMAF